MTWKAPNLASNKHCFFGLEGGVSEGIYKGLNVNTKSDDRRDCLDKNLDIAASLFGLDKSNLLLLNQGVSSKAVYVDCVTQDFIEADGAVTDRQNIVLCIRTADCAPVLLEDRANGVIGVAHAGWRGAYAGIIENVVTLMVEKGAQKENIAAAVGPCIAQKSYEVDEGFYQQFLEKNVDFNKYFIKGIRKGFYQFDLMGFCLDILKKCGIKNVEASPHDTYTMEDKYYSFRRFTHQGIVKKAKCFATELSAIVL